MCCHNINPCSRLCCVAIMVVAKSSDYVCLKISGGIIEAGALNFHLASMQIN
jgi:hypothetical protein